MAPPPLVALRDVSIGFGGAPLFAGVSLALARGDRACLVGRNGSGKSTLLKLLAGTVEPDAGERFVQPGARIAHLRQEPAFDPAEAVASHVARGEDGAPAPAHAVAAMLDRLGLEGDRAMGTLSGGEARRADLARVLVGEPDLLMLDEPTNHLDLPTIEALERELNAFPGAVLVVSHDRAFLTNVAKRILWLDRGTLRETERSFAAFDEWAEAVLAEEERAAQRLDTKIAAEIHWLHRGVTARRKRNQGRLARLSELRAQRASLLGKPTRANIVLREGEVKSRLVIEAERIAKSYGGAEGRPVVRDFSTRILRGDRVGILGPNGAGKTTLLRMLTGDLAPDAGSVRIAQGIVPTYFDQHRAQLDPAATLWETLCPGGGDSVFVQGRPRHVVAYLKDFLFDAGQARSPVSTLSGGERNRLLLAKALAQPSDLLALDEPTNDLDMDTLDLLEEVLGDYEGTLLVVSHDRDFLDRIVTSVIALEGDGTAREYPGGYSDYRRQRAAETQPAERAAVAPRPAADAGPPARPRTEPARLSYREQRDLELLPERIEALGAEIAALEARLADPDLYARDPDAFAAATARLTEAQSELAASEERWLALELKREAIAAARGRA